MKSERRHELQHNELAEWLIKSGDSLQQHQNAILSAVVVAAAVLSILAALLGGHGPAVQALVAAVTVGIGAMGGVFVSALALTVHSAASSSA